MSIPRHNSRLIVIFEAVAVVAGAALIARAIALYLLLIEEREAERSSQERAGNGVSSYQLHMEEDYSHSPVYWRRHDEHQFA